MLEKITQYLQLLVALPFFNRPSEPLSRWQVVSWWEARRLIFNLLVGVAGIITVALCLVSALIGERFLQIPIGLPDPPMFALFAVLAYAVMANLCYTGGWVVELVVAKVWGSQGDHFGKISFVLGIVFSILLTLVPGVLVMVVLGIQLIAK